MNNGTDNARGLETLAIQKVMASTEGRDLLWRVLEQTGVFNDGFSPDPYVHARNAGIKVPGFWLIRELNEAAPASYKRMVEENTND